MRLRLPASPEHLKAITDGALKDRAMPIFPMSEAETRALYAFMLDNAWNAYEEQNR